MFKVAKYTAKGKPVTTFGSLSLAQHAIGAPGATSIPDSLEVISHGGTDNKLLCAGMIDEGGNKKFGLAMLHATNGSLDTSFGQNGTVITDFGTLWNSEKDQIFTTVDHVRKKIYLCSNATQFIFGLFGNPPRFNDGYVIARYDFSGKLDTSFSFDGKQSSLFSSTEMTEVQGISIDSIGRLIVGGFIRSGTGRKLAVQRFGFDGQTDSGFGNSGWAIEDLPNAKWERINDLVIDSENRIIVVGSTDVQEDKYREMLILRFRENGDLDKGRVRSGVTKGFGPKEFRPGRYIEASNRRGYATVDFSDDTLDETVETVRNGTHDAARSVSIEKKDSRRIYNDEREFLVVAGKSGVLYGNRYPEQHVALVKLLAEDGNLTVGIRSTDTYDLEFGRNGKVRLGFYTSSGKLKAIEHFVDHDYRISGRLKESVANVVAVDQNKGDIVVAAKVEFNSANTPYRIVLCKFDRRGQLKTGKYKRDEAQRAGREEFGTDGIVDTGYNAWDPSSTKGSPRDMAIDRYGQIYLVVAT